MERNGVDYIRIITYEQVEEKQLINDIIEVPISFGKDGRLSRSTAFWLKHALDRSKEPNMTVEVNFNW